MFDLFGDIIKTAGRVVGSVVGIPLGVLAGTFDVSADIVKAALAASCETKEEIRAWINDNT